MTTMWWTLGLTVWVTGACVVGLVLGAVVRHRDLPETLGRVGRPVVPLSVWPPPVPDAALPRSAVPTAARAVPQRRRPAN